MFVLLRVLLVLFVDIEHELLGHVASELVLVVEARRDAQMQRLPRLLLSWALFKPRTFASESQLDHVVCETLRRVLAADLDDALHVASLGTDEASGHLEVFLVLDLDFKTTSVLDRVGVGLLLLCLVGLLLF